MKKHIYFRILIISIIFLFSSTGWSATLNVGAGQTYLTIQDAVNAASNGDLINVIGGNYAENVIVNKSVTISGAGSTSTYVITATSSPVFTITVNNVTINGLCIKSNTQLVEGIKVNGATSGLNLDYVDFVNIGNNPGPGDAYGIRFMNSFTNLSINHTVFSATNLGAYSRGMGIYAPGGLSMSNFQIQNSTFTKLFIGVYLMAGIDGFTATNNTFGPQEFQDCTSGASCIYFGDQTTGSIDVKNITITGNNFSNFARGVYIYDYAVGAVIGSVNISTNTFTNSLYSSPIRIIARGAALPGAAEATMQGPVVINDNDFFQTSNIVGGDGVAMIDIRAGIESATNTLNITNNNIVFSGGPYSLATYGILYRGPIKNSNITGNTFDGGNVGGTSANMPPTSGIVLFTHDPNYGELSATSAISITSNNFANLTNAISIYNHQANDYGGLQEESNTVITDNTFAASNTTGIYSGPGEENVLNAAHNYWGGETPASVLSKIQGPVLPAPWCNASFTDCTLNFNPATPFYNAETGGAFATVTAAVAAATTGDVLYFTEPVDLSGFPTTALELTFINLTNVIILIQGASPALSMSSGTLSFDRFAFITPTNTPTIQVTGGSLTLRNCIVVASTGYNRAAIDVSGTGTVDAGTSVEAGNNRFLCTTGDTIIRNTGSGVVDAYTCYWGLGTQAVPTGPGSLISNTGSGSINVGSTFNEFEQPIVDIALYNSSCGRFSVKLRPYMRDIVNSTSNVIFNFVFTVRWPAATGITTLPNVNFLFPTLSLQSVTLSGSYYYAIYAFEGAAQVGWLANSEHEIMNFTLPGTGSGTADFSIVNDTWTTANNGDYYFEMTSNGVLKTDAAGIIYNTVPSAPLNCNIYAKALLTGPYAGSSLMTTYLNGAPNQIPTSQPFNTSPWNYAGSETTSTFTDITDWVLVELRSSTTTSLERKAGLLNKNGNIYATDGVSPLTFSTFNPQTGYYLVVYQRNHSPVMSANRVTVPNTSGTRYDFTVAANLYGSAPAVSNAGAVYTMVPGDINHDGKLKYSGSNNDRALIIAKLGTMFNPVYLNSVSAAGYWLEDLNLNRQIVYSGGSNDASAVIYPAITNLVPGANLISIWNCPVPNTAKSMELCPHTGSIDASIVPNGNNLDVNLTTNEFLTGAYVDNIQFAISWDASLTGVDKVLANTVSKFNLTPQGSPVEYGNKMYQMFAMVSWKALPDQFKPGNEVTVLSIPGAAGFAGKLLLNTNDIIRDNDLGYYVSVFGKDFTGQAKNISVNSQSEAIAIYPNPSSNNNFTITLNSNSEEPVSLQLCDIVGKVVSQQQLNPIVGQNKFEISTLGLTAGTYLVKLSGSSINHSSKLVVQ